MFTKEAGSRKAVQETESSAVVKTSFKFALMRQLGLML